VLILLNAPLFAQPSIRITSPADGAVVNPGQTIQVKVEASDPLMKIIVIGWNPLGAAGTPPFSARQFSITVPPRTPVGLYGVTAVGTFRPREPVYSQPISVDVEPATPPNRLTVEPAMLFMLVGDQCGMIVIGKFGDGSTLDITRSRRTTFISSAPGIAETGADGLVTAKAPGSASILINNRVKVPVTVRPNKWAR